VSDPVDDFEVLHAVRLRGLVPAPALSEMLDASVDDLSGPLGRLVESGAIFERQGRRVGGFALTEEGRATHAEQLKDRLAAQPVPAMAAVYDGFLQINSPLKTMCGAWQQLGEDPAARWEAIDRLEALHATAREVFTAAGAVVPRFGRYAGRLQNALTTLKDGDERYFTSPTVDSYHTVWFEAHEDFMLVLGIDRAAEGSF
jgi:hypothetical protein